MSKNNPKKKTAKQERTKKRATVHEMRSTPAKPPTPAKPEKRQRRRMDDSNRVEELEAKVEELEDKIIELNAENERLRSTPQAETPKKWQRGKLPGERYIKTDPETRRFLEINKAEWDSLA